MSQTFTDANLVTWEAFSSGGRFGLSIRPKVIFHCLTDPAVAPRFVEMDGDEADAEHAIHESSNDELLQMLARSKVLE